MASVFPFGNYTTVGTVLSTTNETAVYTCPSQMIAAFVVWIRVADDAGEARTITIDWHDASDSVDYTLEFERAIAANESFDKELYLVLNPSDELRMTASAAGMHAVVTVIEITRSDAISGV